MAPAVAATKSNAEKLTSLMAMAPTSPVKTHASIQKSLLLYVLSTLALAFTRATLIAIRDGAVATLAPLLLTLICRFGLLKSLVTNPLESWVSASVR